MSASVALPQSELDKVLSPEFNDSFIFGLNKDSSSRKWKFIPLPWKHEKNFRKHALQMLSQHFRPFETALGVLSQKFYSDMSPSIVVAVAEAEGLVDNYLPICVHAILIAQDKDITIEWVEENATSREQMFDIVMKQCEMHQIMDKLGKSLAERFMKLATMLNLDVSLDSLMQLWKQLSAQLSAQILKLGLTADSVIGRSTENSPEITMQPHTTEK